MPRPVRLRSVDDVTATTSSIPIPRREMSPHAALLLTIGGHILVVAIVAAGVAATGLAALAVFGPQVLAAL
jgi:hypothetical protein